MKKKRIAFFLGYINIGTFSEDALNGICAAVPEDTVDLTVILGGTVMNYGYDQFAGERNRIYELVTKDAFDGIIMTTSMGSFASPDGYRAFLDRFAGIPMVHLGFGPAGHVQVLVDGKKGMDRIIRHLVYDHHYSRIAFIRGPESSTEAEDRFEAYKKVLASAGITYDPALVCPGDFVYESGIQAVKILLDERKVKFDAIVGANDGMAFGAKQELVRRGFLIPTDVALAGFDNTLESASSLPNITTARQPFALMGKRIFEKLLLMIDGKSVEPVDYIPAELIIRQSCGCLPGTEEHKPVAFELAAGTDARDYYLYQREYFRERLCALFTEPNFKVERIGIADILDAFYDHIAGGSDTPFFERLYTALLATASGNLNVAVWQHVLIRMLDLFTPLITSTAMYTAAEYLLARAKNIVLEISNIQSSRAFVDNAMLIDMISIMGEMLASVIEYSDLRRIIYSFLPRLGFRNFALVVTDIASDGSETKHLIGMIKNGKSIEFDDSHDITFRNDLILPGGELSLDTNISFLTPLLCQNTRLGYTVCEKLEGLQSQYPFITRELSKNIFIVRLLKKQIKTEESLRALTVKLAASNSALTDFAHIASHDLQEPLRKIRVFGDKLAASPGDRLNEQEQDYIARMLHATSRMQELIDGLLTYSRVTTQGQPLRPVDLNTIVAGVLTDIEVRINETNGRIDVRSLPTLDADPLQMRELFQNIIGNALKYHKKNEPPVIVIESERTGETFRISVTDNGIGFARENAARIFGIFQRAVGKNEYEGTGVGLAICKKIVERHGGTIEAFGEPGKGSVFVLTLPATGPAAS